MTEKKLVKKLSQLFQQDGFLAKNEVGVGYGVADLVLINSTKFNSENCQLRKNYGQYSKLLKEDYFKILSLLPDQKQNKGVKIDYLLEKTNLSKSYLKYTILDSLKRKGFIKEKNKNYYFKINGWMPIAKEVIAVEAKLRDWKKGIYQANRYKSFADKVYLAVPLDAAHLVDRKMLIKYNVGLIVVDMIKEKKTITVRSCKVSPLNQYKKNFAIEHFWESSILKELVVS